MVAAPVVTLHVWRVPRARVGTALRRTAVDRFRARRTPGVRFAKVLGSGRAFGPWEVDLTRWAKLSVWDRPGPDPVARSWAALADETWRAELLPLSSTGLWSRREPFGRPTTSRYDGPVAVLTRARLRPFRAAAFWRAVPQVSAALDQAPGLRAALAVGEAPLGLQGTFSLWESAEALRAFAYTGAAHRRAIEQTSTVGWYAEELFARFAVVATEGTLDGRDPLA